MMGMSDELRSMLEMPRLGPHRPSGTLQIQGEDSPQFEGFTKLQLTLERLADKLLRKAGLTRFGYEPEPEAPSFNDDGETDDYFPVPVEAITRGTGFRAVCAGRV